MAPHLALALVLSAGALFAESVATPGPAKQSVALNSLAPRALVEPEKKEPAPAQIQFPEGDAEVPRQVNLKGRIPGKKGHPVVLVRPLAGGEPWYVQATVNGTREGNFITPIVLGGKNTPDGAEFHLVIVVAKDRAAAKKFTPGSTMDSLPDLPRSEFVKVKLNKKALKGPLQKRLEKFSGYSWQVKAGRRLGPGPNDFSNAERHVRVDEEGHLHLAITKVAGRWQCAEVVAEKSLGYGEYRWVVSGNNLPALDPQVVLGLFTYENTRREIDFELSRWGDRAKGNAQFVVQPHTAKDSTHRFDTGKAQLLTVSLLWEKGQVRGRCWQGEDTSKEPLADWKYTGRHIPPPGKERVRANIWLRGGKPPASGESQEVVIRSFTFKSAARAPAQR